MNELRKVNTGITIHVLMYRKSPHPSGIRRVSDRSSSGEI